MGRRPGGRGGALTSTLLGAIASMPAAVRQRPEGPARHRLRTLVPASDRAPGADRPLRIALLAYRGNPHSGGQGVYVRNLSGALAALGHDVEVIAGQPYPRVPDGVRLRPLPSLDLYRSDDPFRTPRLGEFRDAIDVLEYGLMCTAGFPEPLTFSLRAWRMLRRQPGAFDVVHDNQCLGYGILGVHRDCAPVVATVHHPITVDRRLELAHAPSWHRRLVLRRWYAFTRMQVRVARRIPRLITVSESSRRDISGDFVIARDRLRVIDLGVDTSLFRPAPEGLRIRGRIVTTASADVPLKGLVTLIEAFAELLRSRPDASLVVVGRPREEGAAARAIRRLGVEASVHFRGGVTDEELAALYAEAEVAVVPSLYEGFSLPAVEAMASGLPLVATRAGALPEVVGTDGDTALLVEPGSPRQLAGALALLLEDAGLRRRIASAGRRRVLTRFTWQATARATVDEYRRAMARC